jgi:hypothetical protein
MLYPGCCLTVVDAYRWGLYPDPGFRISKIGDVFVCGARTRRCMAKRMSRRDPARRIGLGWDYPGVADSAGSIEI